MFSIFDVRFKKKCFLRTILRPMHYLVNYQKSTKTIFFPEIWPKPVLRKFGSIVTLIKFLIFTVDNIIFTFYERNMKTAFFKGLNIYFKYWNVLFEQNIVLRDNADVRVINKI